MKFRFLIPVILIALFAGCSKTGTESNPAPPHTDTTTEVPPDTSTLLKTSRIYNFDAAGTTITDSSLYQWSYDNQRRILQQSFQGSGYDATFNYTYLSDRYTNSSVANLNGSLVLKNDVTYFQHTAGKTDSILSSATGYGVQAGYVSKVITYFYYNQAGQDSLESSYDITNGVPVLFTTVNKYYTGNNLDSASLRDGQGNLNSTTHYSGGNPVSSTSFTNNIPVSTLSSTYLDISSGGLFVMLGTSKLRDTYTSTTLPATITFMETNSYEFDSANRVVLVTRDHHGYGNNQKEVYTWY